MKTKKNRSEIASSFPAVARLDLSHVSENKGFGKTNLYVIKTKNICSKDKIYMLQRQKSTVLGLSAPAGAFFSQKKTLLFFENAK